MTDRQISLTKSGHAPEATALMLETAHVMSSAPDYAAMLVDSNRREQGRDLDEMSAKRQWLMIVLIVASIGIIGSAALAITRIERSLHASIDREARRTEAVVAGMADGVMLVDR